MSLKNLHYLKIVALAGLILMLCSNAVRAESPNSSPQLTCWVPGQEQKQKSEVSNLGLIHLEVELVKSGERPFQVLWIPSNKKDWASRMSGIDKKVKKSQDSVKTAPDRKQTLFIQVVSASSKEKIPFTVVPRENGQDFDQDTLSLSLEIPLDAKSKRKKVEEFYTLMDQKRATASGQMPKLSAKERHDRFQGKKFLMRSMLEHRVGQFLISCEYLADREKFWKGKIKANPLRVEVKNKGSFWDRRLGGDKKVVVGGSPSKAKPTKPETVLNALGKEMEQLAYRVPDPPGEADLPRIVEGLTDAENNTRQMALRALMPIIKHNRILEFQGHEKKVNLNQHPQVLASLLKMVKDPDPKNRTGAITVLSIGFESPDKVETVIFEQMKVEDSRDVKMTVLSSIQQAGRISPKHQSFLVDSLNSRDKGLSRQAATTMGAIRMKSGLPLLVKKFETSKIEGSFEAYYRAIYYYKEEAKPYLPKLESRLREVGELLERTNNKKDKRKIQFIQSGLRSVIKKIRKL